MRCKSFRRFTNCALVWPKSALERKHSHATSQICSDFHLWHGSLSALGSMMTAPRAACSNSTYRCLRYDDVSGSWSSSRARSRPSSMRAVAHSSASPPTRPPTPPMSRTRRRASTETRRSPPINRARSTPIAEVGFASKASVSAPPPSRFKRTVVAGLTASRTASIKRTAEPSAEFVQRSASPTRARRRARFSRTDPAVTSSRPFAASPSAAARRSSVVTRAVSAAAPSACGGSRLVSRVSAPFRQVRRARNSERSTQVKVCATVRDGPADERASHDVAREMHAERDA